MAFDFIRKFFKKEKGAPDGAESIDFKEIAEIFKYEYSTREFHSLIHSKELEELAERKGLKDNIEIIKLPGVQFLGRENSIYYAQYKIVIKNLNFVVNSEVLQLDVFIMSGEIDSKTTLSQSPCTLEFRNNTFRKGDSSQSSINCNLNRGHVRFENNKFEDVNLTVNLDSHNAVFLDLIGNEFLNFSKEESEKQSVSLAADFKIPKDSFHNFMHWMVADGFMNKIIRAQKIEKDVNTGSISPTDEKAIALVSEKASQQIINKMKDPNQTCNIDDLLGYIYYDSQRIKVPPEYVEVKYPNGAYITAGNNKFSKLVISPATPITFIGRNIIDQISPIASSKFHIQTQGFGVYWGSYQRLDKKGNFAFSHKEFFSGLKEIAIKKNDKLQEAIINRELIKCESHIIKNESLWNFSAWQDKLIMRFGWVASNHGISWIRPLLWLVGINIVIAGSLYFTNCGIDFGYVLAEMFNPISKLAETTGIKNKAWISWINIGQKIVFALATYEAIRVGRRFLIK